MFENLINTDAYHTQSALDIERRVRQREELRLRLEAESGSYPEMRRKPASRGLLAMLISFFSL